MIVEQESNNLFLAIPEFEANNIPYERKIFPVGDKTFIAEIEQREVQLTFFPVQEGGESVYIRNRNVVGIKD